MVKIKGKSPAGAARLPGGLAAAMGSKRQILTTLMIADKHLLHRRRLADSIDGGGICTTNMRCRRRDLNVGQQSLIRGSGRMTLLRLGLPLSSWRASKAHSGDEGSPALSRLQRHILHRG